ncbi:MULTISPECIES: calcium/sodium antiporter [Pseudomonas syringae group]|uniref:Calcium/sodium antiporter n=4 Tax=Pseudomonas syringae group TaxID=136849 RepID=A0AA40P2R1_9PSED|nr:MULTISPECIES: calcium/sodium antiporter [Pseudomonas syringae group]KGS13595.1 conjugal transfer protein TraR [Pseudomonas coronafaciens]KOP56416.1 conjugal transfer protein TraR [Pseudomonas coronafaciens pv. porri]KOP57826.1 conjugal transfer protein TraR [Pseudomonas coronafaciens pv. porri]KPB54686.1 K+-dependent Na+/Ca+ exchanger related-protein [Pseudomonas coronafaciens pv. oryzae]KPW29593.1 K+-dependent Na+/Ca+ exchanger related-protein [Pseudomonas coronafaciens pv. atropurpurea]
MLSGLLLLLIGAELSVRSAVHLAAIFKVRPLIIGLTVVAMGTSAPQMAVSLQAAFSDNTDIAVGSVIGGNIFNVLVILGLCSLIIPLRVARQVVRVDIPLMIGACLLAIGLSWSGEFSRFDGLLLLSGLLACLIIIIRQGGHGPRHGNAATAEKPRTFTRMAMLATGLLMLTAGGHLLVGASVVMAIHLGLSERIVGLTVIAIGTSLPALMTSLIAALRGERDIAVGNVIGSNLFNLLGVLGLTALVAPVPLTISPNALVFDLPVMLGVSLLCVPLFYSGYRIDRIEGLLLLALYLTYGLHILAISTGMALASRLEGGMLAFVLPVLGLIVAWRTVSAWRRQH